MDWKVILIIVGFAAFVLWHIFLKKKKLGEMPLPIPDDFPFSFRTPGGVRVRSVAEVPASAQRLIDSGIRTQIDRTMAGRPTWTKSRSLFDYDLIFIEPMAINSNPEGSPALIAWGIQCAGCCIGIGGNSYPRPTIVLPHQEDQNWRFTEYLENSARYESEHIALWVNDPTGEFWDFLGAHDIHPIFP